MCEEQVKPLVLTVDHITVLRWLNAGKVETTRTTLFVGNVPRPWRYRDALLELEKAGFAIDSPADEVRGRKRHRMTWDLTDDGMSALETAPKLVRLMPAHVVERFRVGYDEFENRVERVTATGRSTCRSCGQKIAKGLPVLGGYYDFTGDGSRTATLCHIHVVCS